jgi:hypothetical protein
VLYAFPPTVLCFGSLPGARRLRPLEPPSRGLAVGSLSLLSPLVRRLKSLNGFKTRARLGNGMKSNQNLQIVVASGSDDPGIIDRLPQTFSYLNVDIAKILQAPSQRLPAGTCFGRAGAFRRLVR